MPQVVFVVRAVPSRGIDPALAANCVLRKPGPTWAMVSSGEALKPNGAAPHAYTLRTQDGVGARVLGRVPLPFAHDPRSQAAEVPREVVVDVVESRLIERGHASSMSLNCFTYQRASWNDCVSWSTAWTGNGSNVLVCERRNWASNQ